MGIDREKCSEMVREADLDWQRGFCLSGETNRYEALINDAYQKGQRNMRERAARVAIETVCDTHIPTGVKIYGSRAGKAIRELEIE